MMAAITFTFFFRTCNSSSVIALLFFAWTLLMLMPSSNFRTGKNKRAAKIKDVIPYQNVSISDLKKGDSGLQAHALGLGVPGKSRFIG